MSREEKNSKLKKFTTTSNESINKRDIVPTKTSQSMNTESYEYFNQKTSSKYSIAESPSNIINQQSNYRYSSNNQNSNSNYMSKNRVMQDAQNIQGVMNLPGLKCTCNQINQNLQQNILKCTCSDKKEPVCTCGEFKKQLFEEKKISGNNSGMANYGYQAKNQQKIISSSRYSSSNNNLNQNYQASKTFQSDEGSAGKMAKSEAFVSNRKVITYVSPNNPSLQISEEMKRTLSSDKKGKRIEANICTCSREGNKDLICTCSHGVNMNSLEGDLNVHNYSYLDSNKKNIANYKNETYNYSKNVNTNVNNANINRNTYRSYSYDNRRVNRVNKILDIEWRQRCVGQNNESLQILATAKPELIAQCVQDLQVIQEPKPVQILLPIQPNEIDYTLGLEIYGKNSEEERKALKEEERLRKQMEICIENKESLNFDKAYSTIVPHFDNLNIDKKENLIIDERMNRFNDINGNKKRAYSVEHSELGIYHGLKKAWDTIDIENMEMKIYGNKNFNRFNQKVLTTKMNVYGIYKPSWNEANEAVKTTKMNIDGKPESEPEEEPEQVKVKKQPKKQKKPVKKKPVVKKPVKKIVKKVVKKVPKKVKKQEEVKEDVEEPPESEKTEQELDIENFDLNLPESGRKFGPLKVQNKTYNYKGKPIPKEEPKPVKNKYENNETILDAKDKYAYTAEYPKNVDWNEDTIPMSGRPFTIDKKPNPPLAESKTEKLVIKQSYKPKDWNKSIKERNEIKINMPTRRKQKPSLRQNRIMPVILEGKKTDWNKLNKLENATKYQIDKSAKVYNFVLSKENDVLIENEAEEILINDDYNIVEENYARPIRANIRKIPDYTEESVSSDYDILKGIHKHEGQFNEFKDLVSESIKIYGQKVIINDISGKYPRKVETFQGLDEHFEKLANDQNNKKRLNKVKVSITKEVTKNVERSGFSHKEGEGGGIGYYERKRIVQEQTNNEPLQQKVYYFNSKSVNNSKSNKNRKITYEPEHENESKDLGSKEASISHGGDMRQAYYYKEENRASDRGYIEAQEELDEQIKVEQGSHEQPEDKDQNALNVQSKIKYVSKEEMAEGNQIGIGAQHIEYAYEEENNSQIEQEIDQQDEQEVEQEMGKEGQNQYQYIEQYHYQSQGLSDQDQNQYIVKEEIHQEPDGQIRKIQYIYKEENQPQLNQDVIHKHEEENEEIEREDQNQIEIEIHGRQQQQEICQKQQEKEPQNNLTYKQGNKNENIEQSQKVMENQQQQGGQDQIIQKGEQKAYIKEVVYTENQETQDENKVRLRYITLKKKEDQDEVDSQPQDDQPQDEQPQDEQPREQFQEQEINDEQQMKAEGQGKLEQKIESQQIQVENIQHEENIKEDDKKEEIKVKESDINQEEIEGEGEHQGEEYEEEHPQEQIKGEEHAEEEEHIERAEHGEGEEQIEGEEGQYEEDGNEAHMEGEEGQFEEDGNEAHMEGEEGQYDDDGNEAHMEGEEYVNGEEHIEREEYIEGDHIEGEGEGEEHIEGEEHFEGDHHIEENELNQKQDNMENDQRQEVQKEQEEPQRLVSLVEEVTGQNINAQNMNQASMGIQNQLESGANLSNTNLNRANVVNNQTQIRTQIIQTQINNGNINQINIQRQQQIFGQSPMVQAQIQGYAQNIISSDKGQNLVRNAQQFPQNIQTDSSINYEQNVQNVDPMMYSFGGKSATSAGKYLASSGNKNFISMNQREINNSDFLVSSLTNQNTENIGIKQSQFTFGQHSNIRSISSSNNTLNNMGGISGNFGGEMKKSEIQYSEMGIIGNQGVELNSNQGSGLKREPVDRDSKKKQNEEETNKIEANDYPLEPRDSKRNN